MIVGLGHDVCDARRIEGALEHFGERFTKRVFTKIEWERCKNRIRCADCYARRFSAKEALAKALGTGFRRGVYWRDIGVINLPGGKPALQLSGGSLARLEELVPPGMEARLELSLTDDRNLAHAIVLISAVPKSCTEMAPSG
ncbi:MAG: Holo-[acyl-carrier-protein] synthase [Alphaproteobacteria bacterium MarineAlpha9_Bin5]|nr:MAG: Holo-[acyl-carrier-protein] synthase [Alphaproteobacteria bacterium MarineAlpha9_Bin5]HHZ67112.1 holo-ACP synthase [Alphaproteobacteria bacterium]HIB56287.1 holo-ACP synthase [Alphaproteobacteria bacterium]HIN92233.1 holo-ACP synthase [Alphaproteobacteria bacterium]HIO00580.1 holo-ACP synthase [Alphaproteobacteria bacterium]